MTITERLMKPGRFTLRLREDTPRDVWDDVQEFDHIVITPTRLLPIEVFSSANILAAAIYTGVILGKPDHVTFDGEGLAWWLGTDDGAGDLLDTAVSNTAGTLSTWTTSLLPASLTAGTITNTGNTLTYSYQWMSRREAFAHMCRSVGAEWRVNPAGTVDAAAATTLFVSTPTAVITRRLSGPEGTMQGLQASSLSQARDVSKYTQKVIVAGKTGDGAIVANGSATGANVYKDFNNNNVVMERLVNAPTEPAANLTTYAATVLALYSSVRRSIKLSSATYAVPTRVRPGDYVWVYDSEAFLADTSNQITWRGETITPIKLRCFSYTHPIVRGYGVYARRSGATPVYTDLTDWVEWETGDTTWEVGSSFADPDQATEQLAPAFLGVNADVVARATIGQKVAFTPTWSGTLGNGILAGYYQIVGEWLRISFNLTWGTTTSHGASIQSFACPAGLLPTAVVDGSWMGGARCIDNSASANRGRGIFRSGSNFVLMDEGGAFVTNLVPWTWANLDQIIGELFYPL